MKLLAISDVHSDLEGVKVLRSIEKNIYDVVVVAGDIDKNAQEIMQILSTFGCPVLFVLGNWDEEIPYDVNWGPSCTHIHHKGVEVGGIRFVGMSGVVQNWGLHPFAQEVKKRFSIASETRHLKDIKRRRLKRPPPWPGLNMFEVKESDREIASWNRARLIEVIKAGDPKRTVIVTHDRLYRMHEDVPGVPLYLFGHKHEFSDTDWKGSRYLNVSILCTSYIECGSYHDIEIDEEMRVTYETFTILEDDDVRLTWEDWPSRRKPT